MFFGLNIFVVWLTAVDLAVILVCYVLYLFPVFVGCGLTFIFCCITFEHVCL